MTRRMVNVAVLAAGAVAIALSVAMPRTEAQSDGLPGSPTGLCCFVGASCSEQTENEPTTDAQWTSNGRAARI